MRRAEGRLTQRIEAAIGEYEGLVAKHGEGKVLETVRSVRSAVKPANISLYKGLYVDSFASGKDPVHALRELLRPERRDSSERAALISMIRSRDELLMGVRAELAGFGEEASLDEFRAVAVRFLISKDLATGRQAVALKDALKRRVRSKVLADPAIRGDSDLQPVLKFLELRLDFIESDLRFTEEALSRLGAAGGE